MGANLAMNPAAVLTDRRHPNAQRLADGAATLARTNQRDQGNFPGSEPVFLSECRAALKTENVGNGVGLLHLNRIRAQAPCT
jgi:hypothetical protein